MRTAFGPRQVLRGVSFGAPHGQVTALIGASGVGKTTCVRHLTALDRPDHGAVLVEGRSLWDMRKRELEALRKRSGVLLQGDGVYGSALYGSLSVLENVCYQLRAHRPELSERQVRLLARERLAEVGLGACADQLPDELSSGMAKRVGIVRATAADPDFVILDSFELGIDGVRLMRLCELLRRRHAERGGSWLVVTQEMEVAQRLADHVVVLASGRVVEEGPAHAVLASRDETVHQLVTGGRTGPLQLAQPASTARHPGPAETEGYDVPPWLAGVGLLVAVTFVTVLLNPDVSPLAVGFLIVLWAGFAVAAFVVGRRAR